ncbi:MAG: 2'-5' RNA ligase family protein [Thermoplasmataceae archaeon]
MGGDLAWFKSVKKVCRSFCPFDVEIEVPDTFRTSVLFPKISSPKTLDLHRELAGLFDSSPAEILENFELDYYKPHISLAIA